MSTATQLSSADLKERVTELERELAAAKEKLPGALRNAAAAYLGGKANDEVQSVRTQIRRFQDLLAGTAQLAAQAEHQELEVEIERRQKQYEKDAELLVELRQGGTREDAVIEGTGLAWQNDMRADRKDRNAAFYRYEDANNAHTAEATAIEALVARAIELEIEFPDAFD
jgi:hypothetical protein